MSIEDGRNEKRVGQAKSASAHAEWLDKAKAVALDLASRGEFTADDIVQAVGLPTGRSEANANNAVGTLFSHLARGKHIEWTGRLAQCTRTENHASDLRVWQAYTGLEERKAQVWAIVLEGMEPVESSTTRTGHSTLTKAQRWPQRFADRIAVVMQS